MGDPRGEGSRTAHLREEHRMGPGGVRWTARRREQGQMEQGQMGQHPMAGAEEEHLTAHPMAWGGLRGEHRREGHLTA